MHTPSSIQRRFLSLLVGSFVGLAAHASAQCTMPWLPGAALPGVDGPVAAMTPWDPDGPGPLPAVLAVGGTFAVAGSTPANRVAAWDPVAGI